MNDSTQQKAESQGGHSGLQSKKSSLRPWRELLAGIASGISLIAASAAIGFAITASFAKSTPEPDKYSSVTSNLKSHETMLAKHDKSISIIEERIQAMTNVDPITETGAQIAALRSDILISDARIKTLEKGLLDNPERVLSVPLLRNDLQNLKQAHKADIEMMAKSTDRIYDQNKWFIGLMFTMAIALIGLAVSNFVQARKRPVEE